jgi:hypothetical protein
MLGDMKTETKWKKRVEEWRESGQTSAEFCEGKGYAANTLLHWSSRLGAGTGREDAMGTGLEQVRIARVIRSVAEPEAETPIVVEVGGARVQVRRGCDAGALRQVLEMLGGGQ